MIDLSRRLAQNAYHKKSNPTGIVDMGSATNEMMLGDLQKWLGRYKRSDDKARCKLIIMPASTDENSQDQ